ncbi:MAG: helix-turn-helix domain-containing protein [Bacilli bacterium]|nr:helix-turn-helix domain-containing protein [Bacilli bacterium]
MKQRVVESNLSKVERRQLLKSLGKGVREARVARGLTQLTLSLETGLSKAFLSDLECGRRNASFETLCRIAKALKTDVVELIGGTGDYTLVPRFREIDSK